MSNPKAPRKNPQKASSSRDDAKQSRLFMAKAREIGADDQSPAADELLTRLAKMPPEPRKPKRTKGA